MAVKILPGGICKGIRQIEKADSLHISVNSGLALPSVLCVTENGDTRSLHISKQVAEVLIAYGFSYGD